ncbi:MAG: hypothetical protein ABI858_02200 [Pseudoxanthomonas sp.]
MFTLQIQCATIDDAERVLAVLQSSKAAAVVSQVAGPEPRPATTRARRRTPDSAHPSFAEVRAALKAVQARHGGKDLTKLSAILGRFNAEHVSDVKQADYVEFIAACVEA